MNNIWKLVAEIVVGPGDMPSGDTKGFMNVTTWSDSAGAAERKLSEYLETFGWHVVSIEDARPIDEQNTYDEEIADMIERTRANPKAIILGTFFSYKGE